MLSLTVVELCTPTEHFEGSLKVVVPLLVVFMQLIFQRNLVLVAHWAPTEWSDSFLSLARAT